MSGTRISLGRIARLKNVARSRCGRCADAHSNTLLGGGHRHAVVVERTGGKWDRRYKPRGFDVWSQAVENAHDLNLRLIAQTITDEEWEDWINEP